MPANPDAGHHAGEAPYDPAELRSHHRAQKLRWNLPGDDNICNDFSIGPDKALYISDTSNSKIYKLPAGATTGELFLEDHALYGIDGITFLDGVLYVNNVFSNNLYRIPVDAAGKAESPSISGWISP